MAVRAAVLPAVGAPLEITGIELPDPGPGRVRVRLAAAGVCHSDLSLSDGTMRVPVPAVLGHEGAGTVLAVGDGVTHVAPGDGVVLNWAPSCGTCHACSLGEVWLCANALLGTGEVYARRASDGADLHPGLNVAAFAEETVVAAGCVLPAPDGVPLADAALLGCAVLTGYGAVHHSARVREGETVAVFGVGGVGLAALQAARIAGASRIVAVDVSPAKEELARAAGATDYVIASENTAREIRGLTGKQGVDVAVECVGRAVTIRTAWESTRRGGRTTVVGIGGKGGLRPEAARLAALAAASPATVVAVDLPSGIEADTGEVYGEAVRADLTVTFGTHKPGLLVDPARTYAGSVRLVDIGLADTLPATPALESLQH
ncbi:zinc-binding dehydrogenase, partial [Streptomyces scabiei]|uniref:zinc-binding dehydrogenase n=1 Tax=Streptomyces scabiei TaxID=1930 RepID=UPI0029BC4A28